MTIHLTWEGFFYWLGVGTCVVLCGIVLVYLVVGISLGLDGMGWRWPWRRR